MAGGGIDTSDFEYWKRKLAQAGPDARKRLRLELKAVAEREAEQARSRFKSGKPGASRRLSAAATGASRRRSYTDSSGNLRTRSVSKHLRVKLARATTVESKVNGRMASANIVVKKRKLEAYGAWRGAAHDWDSDQGWRHPLLGNTNVWFSQKGHPGVFYKTLARRRRLMSSRLSQAMTDFLEREFGRR